MAERRAAAKGRRMGSSRRKQLREGSGKAPAAAPSSGEEPPWASEIMERVQDFFRERDKDQAGFITRSDVQRLQEENFPCSMEELELVFDGLDAAGTGRLSTEEFIAGLWQFLSSQKAARDHRQLKTTSRRVRLVLPSPVLEGVDSEERRHFAAFMDQLGTDDISEEQEIWQLWVKLRQDEPQLLGNLEDFLAKMRRRIQEAKSKKEALEMTLNKRVAEHNKEVQQLCEALEQQIQQEQQRLQQESMARSHQHDMELQRALDASEREVQRLVMAQMELEARCRSLRSTQQATSTENQQLEESNRVLEDRLQHLHQQLQQTHGRLRTARAMVAWEHVEESGYRVVAELPSKTPMSPQTSPEKSEKYRSEMRIRLGSQSTEPKAKSIHQVVWEMPPPEISLLGPRQGPSSTEEDPFPEFLKEERFSDQSSLLREMNDAIAALSKQLKPQALGAPPVLAETARHPRDDAEPQMGPEAAAAHGTTPGVMRETLSSHVGHELFEGDLKEGPAAAELHAPDATQAGASVGARHRRAEELGAEQGESLEEARRMLFLQGKGTGVKELMLKAAEHPQGALGESMEAGEQALVEMEGEGWMQEKIGWEKAQLLGEAKEAALNQGENPEAGFEPPEAGEAGLAAGWQLAADELGLAAAPEECAQHLGTGLGEEADLPLRLSEKLEIKPGEHLEPELPSWGEVRVGAAQGDGVLPEVTVASDPGMLEEEHVSAEVQPWGETLDANVLPAPAQRGSSGGAGAEEGEVEVTQPREAELQPRGESLRGDAVWGGSTAGEVPLPLAVPLADVQEGRVGPDVQPLEAQSSDANVQLLAEVEAAWQPPSEAGSPGTEQGGSMAPGVQALEEDDKPELGLGEETGAAAVHGEGTSPAETPVGSPDLGGLFPVKAQALQLVEAEDLQADAQTRWVPGPETPQGGGDRAAMQLGEEAEDGAPGLGERELPHEPVTDLHGAGVGQGEGAGAGVQLWEEAVTLGTLEDQSADANVQLLAEAEELQFNPGGSTEAALEPPREPGYLDTEQGGCVAPDVQPLDEADKPELVELVEAEDLQADTQLHGGASPEPPQGGGDHAAVCLGEEAEDGGPTQEPAFHPQGVATRQGEGAGEGVQPWEEAVILDTVKDQSTDANVQLIAEAEKLKLTPGGSTEAARQLPSEAGSLDTEQGGNVAPDVQPLDEADKPELVELVEAEDLQADTQLHGGASPEPPQGGGDHAAVCLGEEAEDGAQGLGERELPHDPVLHPHGVIIRQGEGAPEGVQPREKAESLGTLEDQSTDASMQLLVETEKLKLTPGGSTEAAWQPPSEASSPGTEQGGSMAPGVQALEEDDKPELGLGEETGAAAVHGEGTSPAETPVGSPDLGGLFPVKAQALQLVEAEDLQADAQMRWVPGPETPQGGGDRAAMQLGEEAEDGAPGLGERELPHEPVTDLHGAGVGQGEGAGAGVQLWEEAVTLGTLEDQSADANVQLLAEAEELQFNPGGSTEAALEPPREPGYLDTEQGGCVAPDVQPLDEADKPELVELVEAEDLQADTQLHGGASPEPPQGGGDHAAVCLGEEAEDGGPTQEPAFHPQGVATRQGEGAGEGVQPWEEAVILDTVKDQSTDANVQLIAEAEKLKLTPGGSTEAARQLPSEAGSLDTEQGGNVAPDVQPLDEADKPELVELVEAEDLQADTQLHGGASPEPPQGGGDHAAVCLGEEAEDGAQGLGERELPHDPVLHPHGVIIRQGEGAPEGVQPREKAESLGTLEDQSTDASMQLLVETEKLKLTPGGSTEAAWQPPSEASSLGTEQGGSMAPGVQALEEDDKPELGLGEETGAAAVHGEGTSPAETPVGSPDLGGLFPVKAQALQLVEAEDLQADAQTRWVPGPETPQGGGDRAAMQLGEEAEDGAPGLGERELPHEPVTDLHGAGVGQGEGAGAGVQLWEEAVTLGTLEDQSADANVQLLAEAEELQFTPGGSTEAALEPPREPGYLDTEQGGCVAPDVQPLDEADKPELVELVEAEDLQADTQLHGGASPEPPQGGGDHAAVCLGEEAEDGAQGLGERELPHEPVTDLPGAGVGQGEGAGAEKQPGAEADEFSAGRGDPAALPVMTFGAQRPGAEVNGDVQHAEEEGELELVQGEGINEGGLFLVKSRALDMVEAEDSWADTQLRGGASPEPPQGGGDHAAVCLGEEAEDGAQGLGERELPHDPVLHPHGVIIRQGEGAPEGVQPREKAESLGTLEDQSTDASMQLLVETEKLKLTPGGSTEAAWQPPSEAGSPGTEQGGSIAPGVQALEEDDKPELGLGEETGAAAVHGEGTSPAETPVGSPDLGGLFPVKAQALQLVEAEDLQADAQTRWVPGPETPQGGGDRAAMQLGEEAEDGAPGLGERELPHEPVTDLHGAGVGQGEGAGAGVQLWEEAVTLGTLEDQSADANVQLLAEAEELQFTPGGSTEADLAPLGAAGMQEGEQSQTPGLEAHTTDMWEGAAGAHVSPPAEAALYPQRAAEGPSLEAMLGAFTGPGEQILEDTQTLEILQGERADAEDGPLDGVQGLEWVQGERLEAGAKLLVDIRSLGIKQGHDDGVSVLAPLVSKVTLQINTLKLETMMQEDVLVPDVWRLGDSGQAAQSELQEQVSAQAVKVRLHTASQQPEEKPPHVMETERVAAGPAEPPKQEVPPASTLHTRVQQEEDAGNDQSGMVLRDSSLGDAAISSMQPQRRILGEQSKDLNVGQQEKKQEVGRKTSQEGKPSSGQPGAVTADGAGAAPRGSPEASLDPDHLYNVLFVGDSHVGKTSFLYRLHADTFNPHLNATVGLDYQVKNIVVDNKRFALRLWDSAGQERYHSITKQFFRKADGVVLMYDITSEYSFSDVRYWLSCIQEGAEDGVAILLLGNKTDCAAERRVPTEEGERLAKEHQLMFYECSAASGHNVSEAMVSLIRLLKVREDELKNKAAEVPKPLQKKKGCC